MQGIRKWKLYSLALVLVAACMLTACQGNLADEEAEQITVFTVGDEAVYLNEVWIYAKTIQQEYEKNYGSGIWTVELQNDKGQAQTVEDITKEDIIEEILQVKVLNQKASTFGIALTAEDQASIEQQANNFINGLTDADKQETGITFELAASVYEENMIAGKVYERIMADGSVEVSDEQCRQTKIYDLYFPIYAENENGQFKALSREDQIKQYDNAKAAYDKITADEDSVSIENAAYEFGADESSFYTMSKSEYITQYGIEITDQLYELKDGDYLGIIESEYGYHIFQMVALTDAEATQSKKLEMEEELKREYFNTTFQSYLDELDSSWKMSKNVDEEAWNLIRFAPESESTEEK